MVCAYCFVSLGVGIGFITAGCLYHNLSLLNLSGQRSLFAELVRYLYGPCGPASSILLCGVLILALFGKVGWGEGGNFFVCLFCCSKGFLHVAIHCQANT